VRFSTRARGARQGADTTRPRASTLWFTDRCKDLLCVTLLELKFIAFWITAVKDSASPEVPSLCLGLQAATSLFRCFAHCGKGTYYECGLDGTLSPCGGWLGDGDASGDSARNGMNNDLVAVALE
jgi:hypothetical protein